MRASPSFISLVNGYENWSLLFLVSLPWDGDFKEYSQAAAEAPCFGQVPRLLWPDMDCLIPLLGGKKRMSFHLSKLMSSRTRRPLSRPSGLSSASSLPGGTSPLLPPSPLPPVSASPWAGPA